jgi:hypothetical protein
MKYYILSYLGKERGLSGEDKENGGNSFDLSNACKECGSGANLIGNLSCKSLGKTKNDFFSTINGDFIISESLFKIFNDEKLKLGKLKNVVDLKRKPLTYYHFKSDFILPKSSKIEGLVIEEQCDICKRNGYYNKIILGNGEDIPTVVFTVKLSYNNVSTDFLNRCDIFHTWENMGTSNLLATGNRIIGFSRPLLIISESLKNILQECLIKDLGYEEVFFT